MNKMDTARSLAPPNGHDHVNGAVVLDSLYEFSKTFVRKFFIRVPSFEFIEESEAVSPMASPFPLYLLAQKNDDAIYAWTEENFPSSLYADMSSAMKEPIYIADGGDFCKISFTVREYGISRPTYVPIYTIAPLKIIDVELGKPVLRYEVKPFNTGFIPYNYFLPEIFCLVGAICNWAKSKGIRTAGHLTATAASGTKFCRASEVIDGVLRDNVVKHITFTPDPITVNVNDTPDQRTCAIC